MDLTMTDDPICALLDQLAAHAERIERLDARETGDVAAVSSQLATLAALAGRLDGQVAALAARLAATEPAGEADGDPGSGGERRALPYVPAPARRWWKLTGEDRAQAIAALRAWLDQVYRPGYGHLAEPIGPCWEQHPLCLYALDILAELWSVLYLAGTRTTAILSAQAEYQARIVPALAAQMSAETGRCSHGRNRLPPGNDAGGNR
jgi:hypothetical protein